MPPKILYLAFTPFSDPINASKEVVQKIKGKNYESDIFVLSTMQKDIDEDLNHILNERGVGYDYIIVLGENNDPNPELDHQRKFASFELFANNVDKIISPSENFESKEHTDKKSTTIQKNLIGGRYIDQQDLGVSFSANDMSVNFGDDAGKEACNYVYKKSLEYMQSQGKSNCAVLFHVNDYFYNYAMRQTALETIKKYNIKDSSQDELLNNQVEKKYLEKYKNKNPNDVIPELYYEKFTAQYASAINVLVEKSLVPNLIDVKENRNIEKLEQKFQELNKRLPKMDNQVHATLKYVDDLKSSGKVKD